MDRSSLVFLAQLAEQADRFDDMTEHMTTVATDFDEQLSIEERNLLAIALKNKLGQLRVASRALAWMEEKGKVTSVDHLKQLTDYKAKLDADMMTLCTDALTLIDTHVLPKCQSANAEQTVFFDKMKGDYYRYLTEVQAESDPARARDAELAVECYTKAFALACVELPPTHPIRLGLVLNFSVCLYDTVKSPERACRLAKEAFDDAIADLDTLGELEYRDSTLIMQVLRDNLTLWTASEDEDEA
ncbi:Aste57867_11978 [Aphanomyces stellatus]|uniref:Aste57867_11978 protein n=1 Tax=Aphanomyces stellatus TaxID=120398 RepID=A0A485K5E6_9STRA|nr:hypothetical protein As57867_011933 [Aphanomyces stellatus]KAF0720217.1 hypothetical protein As57867_000485 [Aphanomyces stellatus]VFT77711.1 Aste57867_486 [Aphanomyces stellatus]VFT88833.1 Aste57867_11978 [Aphanomyces stellatus]